jgi:peptidoglycan/LPS O-acetylase OafA/YrhL
MLKFEGIQTLRAIAANAVVAAHLSDIERKYAVGQKLLPDWAGVVGGATGVNLFFVISGFVMALVTRNARWTDFMAARIIRIYPIYWFYTSLVLAVFLIRPDIVNQSYAHAPSLLKSYLLWPEDVKPLLGVGWTLIHEMYFYIVLAAVIAFAIPLRYALAAWALLILAAALATEVASPVVAVIFHPVTLEFIAGAAIGLIVAGGAMRFGRRSVLAGLVTLICGVVFYNTGVASIDDRWARVIYLGVPFVPLVYGIAVIERNGDWPNLSWASKLGDASYSIYLSHVLTVSLLGRLFMAQPFHNAAVECVFLVACIVAANAVGMLSFSYLELPTLRFLRRRRSVGGTSAGGRSRPVALSNNETGAPRNDGRKT